MRSRVMLMALCALAVSTAAVALEFREEPYRVGIIDVGEPILLERPELSSEMKLNTELREWIRAYGRPEYAEFQKVALTAPFLPYEIRLYYIEARKYVAFGRVNVSPAVDDFGVRKFVGKLDSSMLQRLLTARPLSEAQSLAAAPNFGHEPPTYRAPVPVRVSAPSIEEVAVEEIVEIVTPEEVVGGEDLVGEVAAAADNAEAEVEMIEEEIVIEADLDDAATP